MVRAEERRIYSLITSRDGIKAREIAKELNLDRKTVNHLLYASPYMHELCYQDREFAWHGLIRQGQPHIGLEDFSGYYNTVRGFLLENEEEWFERLCDGCSRIGRNLNDTRGLFHSFRDARKTMRQLFADLDEVAAELHTASAGGNPAEAIQADQEPDRDVRHFYDDWEIVFELRIKRSRHIRIYADVLVITGDKAFSLEFKMKDVIEPEEVKQAAKYTEYMEVILGDSVDVIPALVLTKADDLYRYVPIGDTQAELPVCAGNMLFNLFDEYLEFLER